ncbi:MAG: hypothetical protein WAQ05_13755 [Rubrivivax sp.]
MSLSLKKMLAAALVATAGVACFSSAGNRRPTQGKSPLDGFALIGSSRAQLRAGP